MNLLRKFEIIKGIIYLVVIFVLTALFYVTVSPYERCSRDVLDRNYFGLFKKDEKDPFEFSRVLTLTELCAKSTHW